MASPSRSACCPYNNGCYVQHGHDIEFLDDTDGDGKADKTHVILTGFGVQDSHLLPHQFTRAPGGWIWMAQGAFNYGKVRRPGEPTEKACSSTRRRMAKFRPDGSQFDITCKARATSGASSSTAKARPSSRRPTTTATR